MTADVAPRTPEIRRKLIQSGLEDLRPLVVEAFAARDWEYFGYESWIDYLTGEFGGPLLTDRESRPELVADLRREGASYRQIGQTLGIDHTTAIADMSTGGFPPVQPEYVIGNDGKRRQPLKPSAVITPEQQRQKAQDEADRRHIDWLHQACIGLNAIQALPDHPRRDKLLAALTDRDRANVLFMERKLT